MESHEPTFHDSLCILNMHYILLPFSYLSQATHYNGNDIKPNNPTESIKPLFLLKSVHYFDYKTCVDYIVTVLPDTTVSLAACLAKL